MPKGMFLKSDAFASNLSAPCPAADLESFSRARAIAYHPTAVPVPLAVFSAYGLDFQNQFVPALEDDAVMRIARSPGGFQLSLQGGGSFEARRVVVAVGLTHFDHLPPVLAGLPRALASHSSAHHDLTTFRGREVAVIGGGSSAVDLAALLAEAGAEPTLIARSPRLHFFSPPRVRTGTVVAAPEEAPLRPWTWMALAFLRQCAGRLSRPSGGAAPHHCAPPSWSGFRMAIAGARVRCPDSSPAPSRGRPGPRQSRAAWSSQRRRPDQDDGFRPRNCRHWLSPRPHQAGFPRRRTQGWRRRAVGFTGPDKPVRVDGWGALFPWRRLGHEFWSSDAIRLRGRLREPDPERPFDQAKSMSLAPVECAKPSDTSQTTTAAAPSPTPHSARVLVVTTLGWPSTARLALALFEAGARVEAISPPGHALRRIACVERTYVYPVGGAPAALRKVIDASACDLLVAGDDRAAAHLRQLHGVAAGEDGHGLRALIERSLGAAERYALHASRARLMIAAREAGVRAPLTSIVNDPADLARFFAENGGPAVLKADGSWGGAGVAFAKDVQESIFAFKHLAAPPSVARAFKRRLMDGETLDAWPWRQPRPGGGRSTGLRSGPAGQRRGGVLGGSRAGPDGLGGGAHKHAHWSGHCGAPNRSSRDQPGQPPPCRGSRAERSLRVRLRSRQRRRGPPHRTERPRHTHGPSGEPGRPLPD